MGRLAVPSLERLQVAHVRVPPLEEAEERQLVPISLRHDGSHPHEQRRQEGVLLEPGLEHRGGQHQHHRRQELFGQHDGAQFPVGPP